MSTERKQNRSKTKVKKVKVNEQMIKDLDPRKAEQVKGGIPGSVRPGSPLQAPK